MGIKRKRLVKAAPGSFPLNEYHTNHRELLALMTGLLAKDSPLECLQKLMSTSIAIPKNFSPAMHFTRLAH